MPVHPREEQAVNPDVLKDITVFSSVDDAYLRDLASFARETSVPEGATIINQGDFSYDLVAIVEGEAEVSRDGQSVATLGAGDSFGEIGVLDHTRRTATVTAKTPMRLACWTSWDVKRLSQDVLFAIRDQVDERALEDLK